MRKVYQLLKRTNGIQRTVILFTALLAAAFTGKANNVSIGDIKVINNGNGDAKISFDISWENSWRLSTGQSNYDGVWVFFKYRAQNTNGLWFPLQLSGNNPAGTGYSIFQTFMPNQIPAPSVGAIIYRSAVGIGTSTFNDVQLSIYPSGLPYNVDIKAFAIEMAYIPPVDVVTMGDGNGTQESVNAFHLADKDNTSTFGYYIPGFPLVSAKTDANTFDDDYLNWENGKQLYITDSGWSYTNDVNARNKKWATGQPVWCMKYEISQGGYRDFLNTLTLQQQAGRTATPPTSARGTLALATGTGINRTYIKIDTASTVGKPAVYGTDYNGNALYNELSDGYLSWPDVAAYLEWSGLAPMTEVLYERICRGHTDAGLNPVQYGEYAWGTTQVATTPYTIGNVSLSSENITNITPGNTIGMANYTVTSP
ncbi:MAG: hypothetical protein ABI921_11075, partial [Panacibacter sp.]